MNTAANTNAKNKTADPKAANFTFGIEIECFMPIASRVISSGWSGHGAYSYDAVAGGYDTNGEWAEAPRLSDGTGFEPTSDSSLIRHTPNGYRPVEFVSTILKGNEGVKLVGDFCNWLEKLGAKVNRATGLHIHVGVASVIGEQAGTDKVCSFVEKVASIADASAKAIFASTGTDRHLSQWCHKLTASDKESLKRSVKEGSVQNIAYSAERYRITNLQNVHGRGTIEFRAFAGTVNGTKIKMHLATVLGICSLAATNGKSTWSSANERNGTDSFRLLATRLGWFSDTARQIDRAAKGCNWEFGMFGELMNAKRPMLKEAKRLTAKFDARF